MDAQARPEDVAGRRVQRRRDRLGAFVTEPPAVRITVNVTLSTSDDSSYQDAYLAPASIHQYQSVASGATNVITVAASTNRAWKVTKITTAFDVAAGATVLLTVESPASTILHAEYVALAAGTYESKIPSTGVVGGLGDALVVRLAAPGGSVVSKVNALVGVA